jgi:transposase
MDQFPEMKGFYIVMDNAPIHTADEIEEIISKRGYRSIYLPPYSPELNPIENFWSTMKSYVKRTKFNGTDDLKMRVAEASNEIRPSTLRNISHHSVKMFDKCLRMEPL